MRTTIFRKKILNDPPTIGQQLKAARRRQRLRLADVENQLKIQRLYLEAIEADRFGDLPGLAYTRRFIRTYAQLVKINPQLFDDQLADQSPLGPVERFLIPGSLRQPKIFITPKLLMVLGALSVVLGITGYIGYQIERFSRPPILEVFSPIDGSKVLARSIDITGQTSPGAVVVINGEPVAQSADGQFSQPIELVEGVNSVHIIAKNRFNRQREQTINIIKPKDGEQALHN